MKSDDDHIGIIILLLLIGITMAAIVYGKQILPALQSARSASDALC